MSLALTQPPGGLTFNPQSVQATTNSETALAVGLVVHVTDSALLAVAPTDASVLVGTAASTEGKHGFYGVVTKEITASSPGTIAFTGIQTCTADNSPDTDWVVGMAMAVDADGELVQALDTNVIVGYAMEALDVGAGGASGRVYMCGAPAISTMSKA